MMMTISSTLQELLLVARTTRARQHEREVEIQDWDDRAEESGGHQDAVRCAEIRREALEGAQDDLWHVVELVESLGQLLHSDPAVAADDLSSLAAALVPAVGTPAVPTPAVPAPAVPTPAVPTPAAMDQVTSGPVGHSDYCGECLPMPTVVDHVARRSAEYRDLFEAHPGQLVIDGCGEGERLTAMYGIAAELLDDEMASGCPILVRVAVADEARPGGVVVISGSLVEMAGSGADEVLRFADGTTVHYYDIVALKFA